MTRKNCELCENEAVITTRLNPESYLCGRQDGKLIVYDCYNYCEEHFYIVLNELWRRVGKL